MKHPFDEAPRANRGMSVVLLAVSLPCLLAAGWLLGRALWDRSFAQEAVGSVVEISGEVPALTVEFDAGEASLRRVVSAGSDLHRNYAVGDRIRVWFDPAQPQAARLDIFIDNWLFPLLLGVFGGFFALPLLFVPDLRPFRWPRRRALATGGSRVQADFDGVRPVLDVEAMRRLPRSPGSVSLEQEDGRYTLLHDGKPRDPFDALVQRELGLRYVLQAKWTDSRSGIEYFFESAPLADNPERHARDRKIPVFIDPQDPQRYRMDLSFLPGQALGPARSSVIS
jgi:hypothetical protein